MNAPIRNNDVDFVKTVFDRLFPKAKISITYDWKTSLQATILVENFDGDGEAYKPANFDLALFLDRYERVGIALGDERTKLEMLQAGACGLRPPTSTGQGIPQADPFAPPEGLPTADRLPTGQKPR